MGIEIAITTATLDRYIEQCQRAFDEQRQRVAFAIQADTMAAVHVDTGTLRRSWQVAEDGPGRTVIFSDVEYAPFQEYGGRFTPANPALTQAVERNKDAFLRFPEGLL